MFSLKLIFFAVFWLLVVYGYNCLLARKFLKPDLRLALLYFATVAMIGVFGEILLDTVYKFFVGNPLWHYNILPIHNGYTSAYAPVIWGIYGIHLYFLHRTLKSRGVTGQRYLALIFCLEALIAEALVTISARYFLSDFMYYYYPGDLWHVSSFQNLPFYFICGLVIVKTIKRFKVDTKFFTGMCIALTAVVVFFA